MPELVLTLNCLELLSLPPTLSFLGSHSVTWPLTISFSSKMAKAKLQTVALLLDIDSSTKDTSLVMLYHLLANLSR